MLVTKLTIVMNVDIDGALFDLDVRAPVLWGNYFSKETMQELLAVHCMGDQLIPATLNARESIKAITSSR